MYCGRFYRRLRSIELRNVLFSAGRGGSPKEGGCGAGEVDFRLDSGEYPVFLASHRENVPERRLHILNVQPCAIGQADQITALQNSDFDIRKVALGNLLNLLKEKRIVFQNSLASRLTPQAWFVEKRDNEAL